MFTCISSISSAVVRVICVAPLLATPVQASADRILGVFVGAYSWQQNYDGEVLDLNSGISPIDFESTLNLDDESNNVFYLAFEHPVPILPNFELVNTTIESEGHSMVTSEILAGITVTGDVNSIVDFSHTDVTAYWQLLDNWVSLDLGLTARMFDGSIQLAETSGAFNVAREEVDKTIPMIFARARFDLPFSGLHTTVSGNGISDGDNKLFDYQLSVGYETDIGLGIDAGYRRLTLELEDINDIDADGTIKGGFIGLFYHF